MKRGEIKGNRLMASKPSQNKTFKELVEEFIRQADCLGISNKTF
jgi:uncharacterized protein YaaR (DUF327 family)